MSKMNRDMDFIKNNIEQAHQQIADACRRSGRLPTAVQIMAITKTVAVPQIREALAAGISLIGENRVQEAADKYNEIGTEATWHLVGHLQTNKVKRACEIFSVIQAVDSLRLAEEIDERAAHVQRVMEILIEVNTSGEDSKFGVRPEEAAGLAFKISGFKNIKLTGLMTIGAFLADAEQVRPCFKILREIRDDLQKRGLAVPHLSMGMSNDYVQAVEEGATLIRLGRALFGERNYTG